MANDAGQTEIADAEKTDTLPTLVPTLVPTLDSDGAPLDRVVPIAAKPALIRGGGVRPAAARRDRAVGRGAYRPTGHGTRGLRAQTRARTRSRGGGHVARRRDWNRTHGLA